MDLICISDVVRAIEKAITTNSGSQIINIGSGYSIKLKEILEFITQFLEYDIEVINLNDDFLGGAGAGIIIIPDLLLNLTKGGGEKGVLTLKVIRPRWPNKSSLPTTHF